MKESNKEIAKERIEILFSEAKKQALNGRLDLCNRYVFIARKLSSKYTVQIPRELRRQFCHSCYHYLYPGINCKVRTNKLTQSVEYDCSNCGKINRYPYIKEKHEKRSNSKN